MTYRLVHVAVGTHNGYINHLAIQTKLNAVAADWLQYASSSWLLWTNKSNVTVSEMLRDNITSSDHILVVGIARDDIPAGSLQPWMWEWVNRPRDPNSGDVLTPALPAPSAINLFTQATPTVPTLPKPK